MTQPQKATPERDLAEDKATVHISFFGMQGPFTIPELTANVKYACDELGLNPADYQEWIDNHVGEHMPFEDLAESFWAEVQSRGLHRSSTAA